MESTTERYEWTPRQRQVFELLMRGYTNAQIAEALGVSLDGAKWHVREIISILGVEGREEAAEYWRRRSGLTARFRHLAQALWFLPRLGLAKAIVASLVVLVPVGVAIAVAAAINGTGPEAEFPASVSPSPAAFTARTPAPAATLATGRLCIAGDLLIGSDERLENGAIFWEVWITKPRWCDIRTPMEAFVVEPGADFNGRRIVTQPAMLVAPSGTDRVLVRVTWRNWCGPVPTPSPTPSIGLGGGRPFQPFSPPVWLSFMASEGLGSGDLYPPCLSAGAPTTLEIAVTTEPDPPAAAISASPAPAVSSAADLEAFARWFASVVAARDDVTLMMLARAMTRPPSSAVPSGPFQQYPVRTDGSAEETLTAYFLDKGGSLGSESVFAGRLMETTAASGALRAAGCAVDAPACERFVVAFEAVQGQRGPGSYQAYAFEVVDGKVALRGLYPGGGDRDTVFAGGVSRTPWGEATFVPLPATGHWSPATGR